MLAGVDQPGAGGERDPANDRRHASRHADEVGDPIARSFEPGEDGRWCDVDELMFRLVPE